MYLRRLTSCSRALAFVGVGARALAFLGVGVGVAPRGVMSLSGTAPPPAASCRLSERVRDGCLGAVKAGFVADAASMGLHWIYDVSKLKELTKSQPPEFFEPPSCPFYKYEPGQLSPYGAEALGVLHVLSPCHDKFEPQNFSLGFQQYLKKYPGRLNHASKELIAAVESGKVFPESGADDAQANSLVKVAVALSKFEGRDDWAMRVEDVLRAHQNNEIAVRYGMAAAHLMRHILQSGSIRESLAWVRSSQQQSLLAFGLIWLPQHHYCWCRTTLHGRDLLISQFLCSLPPSLPLFLHPSLPPSRRASLPPARPPARSGHRRRLAIGR